MTREKKSENEDKAYLKSVFELSLEDISIHHQYYRFIDIMMIMGVEFGMAHIPQQEVVDKPEFYSTGGAEVNCLTCETSDFRIGT